MKIKYFLLSAIVLATSFASCVDDKEYVYDEGNNVKFNSTVAGQSALTRAAGTAWEAGDAIGIYMKTGTGLTNIVDGAANQKHTTATTTGKFSPADPIKNAIFFPTKGTVDFIAYYPYSDKLENNIYKVDVTNQASQEKIDLLYSNNATGKSNGDEVTLNFTHQLTKVVFSLKGANTDIDLTSVKVEISDMPTKGTYDLASGALTVEEAKAAIALKSTVDAASKLNAVAEGIVIPTAKATRKVSFTFKRAGQTETHTWDASEQPFDKGMKNTYNVQLGGDKGVLVSPESNIQDWGPGSSQDIIIDLDGEGETTVGDGTQAKPYTVADAALKVGTNETWVKGFILGSSAKTKSLGGASKDNIVLAAVAGETDESKWIIIDLKGSGVAGNLDIVTNPELIAKEVKVKGNIVKDIFGGALAMTLITAQEGGKDGTTPPDPAGNLLFTGSDFNDWAAFLSSLSKEGLKPDYPSQSVDGGREGSSALYLNGKPKGNDYVFSSVQSNDFTANPSKITFYIKGTSTTKSLSMNIYTSDGKFKAYNLEACTEDKTLDFGVNNQYNGTIDTAGKWVKITLNVADLDLQKTAGENIFALKVGKEGVYDLLVDDIMYE